MDGIVIRLEVDGSDTGGQLVNLAHHAYFVKTLIEGAVKRGQLPKTRVVGYEMRNLTEMVPANPRK